MRICTCSNNNLNTFSQKGLRPCVDDWPTAIVVVAAAAHRIWPQAVINLAKIMPQPEADEHGEELDLITLGSRLRNVEYVDSSLKIKNAYVVRSCLDSNF